jgi:hypothetical protein
MQADTAFQADTFGARRVPPAGKIWRPTAVRTFFQGPGENAHNQSSGFRAAPGLEGLNARGPLKVHPKMTSRRLSAGEPCGDPGKEQSIGHRLCLSGHVGRAGPWPGTAPASPLPSPKAGPCSGKRAAASDPRLRARRSFHSTSRITLRRFIRSRACTTSLLSSTASRRSTVRFASPRYSPKMRLASSTARMMVSWSGLFMTVRQLHEIRIQDGGRIFVPVWRCGFMSRRLTRQSRVLSYSRVDSLSPRG